MGRSKRAFLTMCSALALTVAAAIPLPVAAIGDVQVKLSCSDGTETVLSVDAATLLELKDAVEAMTLYPAGLTCGLTEHPLSTALGASVARADSGPQSYVVGGGRWNYCGTFINIAVNARIKADGTFEGTINQTIPSSLIGCLNEGQLRTKVTCVEVVNNSAVVTSEITKSTGHYDQFVVFNEGNHVDWTFIDGDQVTPTPTADLLRAGPAVPPQDPCALSGGGEGPFPLANGSLLVRDST